MIVIKALDKSILNNTKFVINPCLEFACAFGTVGNKEILLNTAREMNFNLTKKDEEFVESLENNISKHIRSEIEYFFKICNIQVIIAAFTVDYEGIDNVDSLLKLMDKTDETVFFKYLGGIFIAEQLPKFNIEWDEVNTDIDKMKNYIKGCEVEEVYRKESLLECYENPEETKLRLCFLFRQFYEKSYKPIENKVLQEIEKVKDKYINVLNSNPKEFIEKYFFNFFKVENEKWEYKLNIHLSLFLQIYFWNISIHDYKEKWGWSILGIRTYELYFRKETTDRVDKFLKVLSDKRRIDIIKLLSCKVYYGYEIAAKLNLTPATVNYHMGLLLDADIITFDREDNKIYYSLNKNKIKELLKETGSVILNE